MKQTIDPPVSNWCNNQTTPFRWSTSSLSNSFSSVHGCSTKMLSFWKSNTVLATASLSNALLHLEHQINRSPPKPLTPPLTGTSELPIKKNGLKTQKILSHTIWLLPLHKLIRSSLWSRQILQINILQKPVWNQLGCVGVKILVRISYRNLRHTSHSWYVWHNITSGWSDLFTHGPKYSSKRRGWIGGPFKAFFSFSFSCDIM